ncbi:MAG: hypothetical protein LBN29_01870 [Mediterranea sp.]|jgi:hypothetical protein|nr:hypothetical protein [Mediterranea sp.]
MKRMMFRASLCALFLTGWVGCADEVPHPDEGNEPLIPDAKNMVTLRVSVGKDAYQDGFKQTRAPYMEAPAPVQFVQEVGHGYALVSELTASPATRADATRAPLAEGVTVLMIAFEHNATTPSAAPIGYQPLTVDDGMLNISLPATTAYNYRLVFYSENRTATIDPAKYVSATGTAVGEYGYHELPDGATLTESPAIPMVATATGSPIPVDFIYGMMDNVSTATSTRAMPTVTFKHAFAQLTWKLEVNKAKNPAEYIGEVDAGFYPRYADATLNLDAIATTATPDDIPAAVTWSGGTQGLTKSGSFFRYSDAQAASDTALFCDSVRFIPIVATAGNGADSSYIYLNKIVFKIGTERPSIDNKPLLIRYTPSGSGEPRPILFKPGMKYTITSKLTKSNFFKAKTIYGVANAGGLSATCGYAGETAQSYNFLKSPTNFSLTGTVPVNGGISIEQPPTRASNDISTNSAVANALQRETPPDILILGAYSYFNATGSTSRAILDYLDKGGVVFMFYEYGGTSGLAGVKEATDDGIASIVNDGGYGGTGYQMSDTPSDDPIISGTVGGTTYDFTPNDVADASVAGKYWGDDSGPRTYTFTIASGRENDFIVYSRAENGKPTMLRYKKKNLILVGDGGFLSYAQVYASTTACPFYLDFTSVDGNGAHTYTPAPRSFQGGEGSPAPVTVYNSQIFANMMAWAIYEAEYHGINSGGLPPAQ